MPDRFISKTASNGYAIGSDSNNGRTRRQPYATIAAAIAEADAAGGDWTLYINDGIYSAAELNAASEYIILPANPPNLNIQPETEHGVSLVSNFSTAIIRYTSNTIGSGQFLTLGPIVLGSEGDPAAVGGVDSAYLLWLRDTFTNQLEVTLQGTRFVNSSLYSVQGTNVKLTARNITHELTRATGGRSFANNTSFGADGDWDIDGLQISADFVSVSGNGGIVLGAAASGGRVRLANVRGRIAVDPDAAGDGDIYALLVANVDDAKIIDPDLYISNPSPRVWGVYGAAIRCNDASLTAHRGRIIRPRIRADMNGAGFLAVIGGDLSGEQSSRADGGRIEGGSCSGNDSYIAAGGHGVGVSKQDNARIEGVTVRYADIGLLLKETTGSRAAGCLTDYIGDASGGGHHRRFKAGADCQFFHCTAIVRDGYLGAPDYADSSGVVDTTGGEVRQCSNLQFSGTLPRVVFVDADNAVTFSANNYDLSSTAATAAWSYAGTDYNDLDAWKVGVEATATEVPAGVIDAAADNFRLSADSALRAAGGGLWGAEPRAIDADGEPYPDNRASIGAFQFKNVSGHPSQS